MVLRILSLYIFLLILKFNFFLRLNNSSLNNKTFLDEEIQRRIKLYLPEYQNKHIRINELNNTNFDFSKIRNTRNSVLVTDDILEIYDEAYRREKISEIINSQYMINLNGKYNNKKYSDEYKFYATRNNFMYDHNYVWHKYINRDAIIYEKTTSIINEVINTEPQQIILSAQICSMQKLIFQISNPDPELNLLIKDIRSDIYQIQIFPFSKKSLEHRHVYQDLSRSIPPKEIYTLEIFILSDHLNSILGTLYIEFNNKKVLLIPIRLNGLENKYGVRPIYYIEAPIKKNFHIPIKIYNPLEKMLVIKRVSHPIKKMNIFWSNGSSVDNKSNLPSSAMFQINPKSSKTIININYYSASPMFEYGFIQLEITDDIIVIPILINSIPSPIVTYPKFFNFGLCQITSKSKYNIRKIIPINLSNIGTEIIKIGKVYLEYDNIFIQFNQNSIGNNITIAPNEEIKFGYLIFDANVIQDFESFKNKIAGKIQKGSLYIETNSTESPFIQVNYSFLPDMGKIEKIVSGDVQILPKYQNKFNFEIKVKYNAPYGLEKRNNYKLGENITSIHDKYVITKLINPKNEDQSYNVNIYFEIEKLDIFHFKRFFYIPLFLTYSLYSYIPVQLDNNDIIIVYCGTEDNSSTLASCMRTFGTSNMFDNLKNDSHKIINFKFSFGPSLFSIKKKKFIYLVNENSSPIKIEQIKSINNVITLGYENIEYLGNDEPPKYDKTKLANLENNIKNNLKITNKKKKISTEIIIHPCSAIKFSINLNPYFNNNIQAKGKNTIIYNNNSKFIIDNIADISNRSFDIVQKNIKFEPTFPSLVQSILIEYENTLDINVTIHSVKSSDDRIITTLLEYKSLPNNKSKFLKIVLDPSVDSLLKKYLNAIDFSKILTYKELYLCKERDKYWNKLRNTGKTEINANITVNTSMGKKIIKVNSDLILPYIIKSTGITFGLVQIGKVKTGYFEIFNPSDQVLAVKLILAPNDYSNINNNEMLSSKEQQLLKTSEDLMLLACNFIGRIDNDKTLIRQFEYIIIQEKINLFQQRKDLVNKKELIKLIYKYGNSKVKNYLNRGYEVFCKYKKSNKNELIIDYSKLEVVSSLFSEEFEKEIQIVKNITTKDYLSELKSKEIKKETLWEKIYSFFLNLYIKYYLHVSINPEVKEPEGEQNFYLSDSVYNKVFTIPPHQKGRLGPISFKPNKSGNISETIFLKNNLTFIQSLKLLGTGGGAEPSFIPNYVKNPLANSHIFNKTNYMIEIDEITFNQEIKPKGKIIKTITLKNIGNLAMNVKRITIDGYECQNEDLKILQCEEFILSPNENLDIDIEIKPNMNNYITNKNIYFHTDYQVFNLNVIIYIAKDVYIKNNLFKNKILPFIILLIFTMIFYFIVKGIQKVIQFYKNKYTIKEKILLEKSDNNEEKSNFENNSEIEKIEENEKDKQIEEEENINKNLSKNQKKKLRKKNKTKLNEISPSDNNFEKKEIIAKKEDDKIIKEESKKDQEKKIDNYKEFKLYTPTINKKDKKKKKETDEKDKEKINETDSINEAKIIMNNNDLADKNKKLYKINYNSRFRDKYIPKYSNSRKNYYNTYNTYNTYNNYNNYNNYNIPEDKKQGNTVKLSMNTKVNNLSELLKTEPKKDKKIKKKMEKEKNINDINSYQSNNNINTNTPTISTDEKKNKEIIIEQESIKNNDSKNISNNENDCSNSLFNFEGFVKNDFNDNSKINNDNNSFSYEDIKEGDEINYYFNKSLIDKIDNPYLDEDNVDKSKYFDLDFFGDKKIDDKEEES